MGTRLLGRIGVLVLCLLVILTTGPKSQAEETIVLTGQPWYPFLAKDLTHHGFVGHVITEAFALEGVQVIWKFRPPKRALEEARSGQVDGTGVWSSKTPDRLKDFYFSEPVLEGPFVFFHLKHYPFDWKTVDDLKGIKIGAILGQKYTPAFNKAEEERILSVERVSSAHQNFLKLLATRIDILCINRDAGMQILEKGFSPEQIEQITYHPTPIRTSHYSILFSKKKERNTHMLELFNNGLDALKKSGMYDQFYEAHTQGKYVQE